MKVSEIGEFKLIDLLAEMVSEDQDSDIASWQRLLTGIGEDVAAWSGDPSIQLATTDSFIQDVHFSLEIASWEDIGWRVMAANLSDIAAMGGYPRYALVSLAIPEYTEVTDVASLYKGITALARQNDMVIAGGDTNKSPIVSINITVLGSAGRDRFILTRSTARPGELVAVTGDLGSSAAGLKILTKQQRVATKDGSDLIAAFLHPNPRLHEGRLLLDHGVRTAIDISDGLISDLKHICEASRVGARIKIDQVPVNQSVEAIFGERSINLALSGGEDFELLFTGDLQTIEKVNELLPCKVTVVGEILTAEVGEVTIINDQGNPINLEEVGWDHFRQT